MNVFSSAFEGVRIEQLVNENPKKLTYNEFNLLMQNFRPTKRKLDNWYKEYEKRYIRKYGDLLVEPPINNFIGFKSKNKVARLQELESRLRKNTEEVHSNNFPLKENIKNFQLHSVASRYTYLIDLMQTQDIVYLIAININTRYLFARPVNVAVNNGNRVITREIKSAQVFINALGDMVDFDNLYVEKLIGDAEKAFFSEEAINVYHDFPQRIKFEKVRRQKVGGHTEPLHSSLGIIDRVIRTIRDMAYLMKVERITPNIMSEIVWQYNNSPHKTLSKYAGFDVTPKMVQDDADLEEFIVRKIVQENYEIMNRKDWKLENGTNVKVYNPKDTMMKRRRVIQPGEHFVVGYEDGLYRVRDDKNNEQVVPRYRLKKMYG